MNYQIEFIILEDLQLEVGDVIFSSEYMSACKVLDLGQNQATFSDIKHCHVAELTFFVFSVFNVLKKKYGIRKCTFETRLYGTLELNENSTERKLYSSLISKYVD